MGKRCETLKFVQLVQKFPNVYVPKLRYKSNTALRKSWSQIAKKSNCTIQECKEKWRKIRIMYKRSIKRYNKGAPNKPYYLSDYLEFVKPYIKVDDDYDEKPGPMKLEGDLGNEMTDVEQQTANVQRKSRRSLKNTNRCTVNGCCVMNYCSDHNIKIENKTRQTDECKETVSENNVTENIINIVPSLLKPVRSEIVNPEIEISNVQTKEEKDNDYMIDNSENYNGNISINVGNNLNNDYNMESIKIEPDFMNNQNQIYQKSPCCECIENNPRKMFLLSVLPDIESLSESEMRMFRRDLIDSIDRIIYNREKNLSNHV